MGRLILVRHGQSIWNLQNRFTGWVDVSLSKHGMEEATQTGKLLADENFDVAFTSELLRAQDTLYEILKFNRHCEQYVRVHEKHRERYEHFIATPGDAAELKIHLSDRLNERFYGDLQGMNKDLARRKYGAEVVHRWRRGYADQPPNGESLAMTIARVQPYYQQRIAPALRDGQRILVSAHGNSLRALIMHIEALTPQQIVEVEVPTGTPHVYDFDNQLKLLQKQIWPLPNDDIAQ